MRAEQIFSNKRLSEYLNSRLQFVLDQIENLNPDKLLNASIHDLEEYYYETYKIDPIELHEDKIVADVQDTKMDVSKERRRHIPNRNEPFYIPATLTLIEVPFTGIEDLFKMRASRFTYSPPIARVERNKIIFQNLSNSPSEEQIKKEFDSWLSNIKKLLSYSEKDISEFNNNLKKNVATKIKHRKEKLLRDRKLKTELGFPLKKRENETYVTDQIKRKIKPTFPNTSNEPHQAEPIITGKDYDLILDIIDKTATMLERSPSTFKEMGEEQLRDQFLVPLNSHFEGQSTGETFNAGGKSDILIREKDKCLFIAECKIWRGKKYLSEAIDQLLSYTTWRESKTAILIFNRNKDFSSVIQQISSIVKENSSFKKELESNKENVFKFVIAKETDRNRDIYLTVLAFDVPS